MLWRHWRREVTHCELFESIKKLIEATTSFFARYNKVLSIIGATRQVFLECTYIGIYLRRHLINNMFQVETVAAGVGWAMRGSGVIPHSSDLRSIW